MHELYLCSISTGFSQNLLKPKKKKKIIEKYSTKTRYEDTRVFCSFLISNYKINKSNILFNLLPSDETILSEDPTPAETTHHVSSNVGVAASGTGASIGSGPEKQSTLLLLAAVVAIGAVIITSIIVAGIVVVCKHRPRPPQPQDVRKSMRLVDKCWFL